MVKKLIELPSWPWNFVPNINVPAVQAADVKGISMAKQGMTTRVSPAIERRVDLRHQDYYWLYLSKDHGTPEPQEDIAVLRDDYIAVSPLSRNATDQAALSELSKTFS